MLDVGWLWLGVVAYCVLFCVRGSLRVVGCSMFSARWLVCCWLLICVSCSLFVVWCVLFDLCWFCLIVSCCVFVGVCCLVYVERLIICDSLRCF